MKMLLIASVVVSMMTGCAMLDHASSDLYSAMDQGHHPRKGEVFTNYGEKIKVLQVLDGFVLAHPSEAFDDHLVIRVNTKEEYATDEFLLPGAYTYVGTFSYETAPIIQRMQITGQRTVRMFDDATISLVTDKSGH